MRVLYVYKHHDYKTTKRLSTTHPDFNSILRLRSTNWNMAMSRKTSRTLTHPSSALNMAMCRNTGVWNRRGWTSGSGECWPHFRSKLVVSGPGTVWDRFLVSENPRVLVLSPNCWKGAEFQRIFGPDPGVHLWAHDFFARGHYHFLGCLGRFASTNVVCSFWSPFRPRDVNFLRCFFAFADSLLMVRILGLPENLRSSYGSSWGFACA